MLKCIFFVIVSSLEVSKRKVYLYAVSYFTTVFFYEYVELHCMSLQMGGGMGWDGAYL